MGIDLRMPNIVGNDKEQLSQIRSYLYQIVPQLQWALNNIDNLGVSNTQVVAPEVRNIITTGAGDANPQAAFSAIKSLIIKSADIVNAYYDEINRRLEGVYVAESDFGDYAEKTAQTIEENSKSTTQQFENLQVIITDTNTSIAGLSLDLVDANNKIDEVSDSVTGVNALLDSAKAQLQESIDDIDANLNGLKSGIVVGEEAVVIGVKAAIKSGILEYTDAGVPVYGIEIGQSVDVNNTEVFNKYARFTSEKLSFYDSNGYEVAYISDKKLFIRTAEITLAFQIGKLIELVMDNGDVVTKWVGG